MAVLHLSVSLSLNCCYYPLTMLPVHLSTVSSMVTCTWETAHVDMSTWQYMYMDIYSVHVIHAEGCGFGSPQDNSEKELSWICPGMICLLCINHALLSLHNCFMCSYLYTEKCCEVLRKTKYIWRCFIPGRVCPQLRARQCGPARLWVVWWHLSLWPRCPPDSGRCLSHRQCGAG